jgi:transcriptional regulator with XRE-family HTH domain
MTAATSTNVREATATEVAQLVRMFRDLRGWTQDTLAALSRLEVRTIQRVESGAGSSRDTKRAIAGAFGFEDLDAFSKFQDAPSAEQAEKQRQEFERTHVVLDLESVDGRGIVSALIDVSALAAIGHQSLAGLSREAQDAFAALLDYARDCMDVVEVASKTEMLGYGDELQGHVDALNGAGYDLFLARRKAVVRPKSGPANHAKGLNVEILYLVTAPAGASPGKVAVLKETEFGWG